MEQNPQQNNTESGMEIEKMIECTKISTVFNNNDVLEKVADSLVSEGVISGFSIDPIVAGYVYKGSRVEEDQFKLEILISSDSGQEKKEKIISKIREIIGEKWDIPAIQEQDVKVNESFLNFIKRAEIEHKRYKKERKIKLTLAVLVLTAMSGVVGTLTKKYVDDGREKAVAEAVLKERNQTYEKIRDLDKRIVEQISDINNKILKGETLTPSKSDMAAEEFYEETNAIRDLVREVESEVAKLAISANPK